MNVQEVCACIEADDAGKWDVTLERDELWMQDGKLCLPRPYRTSHPDGLALTQWATVQMCQRLNIPTAYFRRCPPLLQDAQVNHWLHREEEAQPRRAERPEHWLLRAKAEAIRGILSDRYARMNNADVLATLEPVLEGRFEVGWFAVTDESLHLRLLDPRLSREVLPGDRVIAGLHIANSEVGKRAVTVDALVYRLVCSNGLVRLVKGRSLLHQRHVALTRDRFATALCSAVREAILQGAGFMERMSWATQEIVTDMEDAITRVGIRFGLSQTLQEQVKSALGSETRGQRDTLYGLVNAFTNVAQGLDPDDRYSLEALAGHLLEKGIPRKEALSLPAPPRERLLSSLFEEAETLAA